MKCEICGKETKNKRFCSMKCYQKYHRARKNVKCIICGKIFNVNKANIQAKYCSRKCYLSIHSISDIKCKFCGKIFHPCSKNTKVCSKKCAIGLQENSVIKKCIICGNKFKVWDCQKKQLTCSIKCRNVYLNRHRIKRICLECKKEFDISRYIDKVNKGNFCSYKCWLKNKSGNAEKVIIIAENYLKAIGERERKMKGMLSPKGNSLRLDVYFEKYNLAIEYNGQQHYKRLDFFHSSELDYRYLKQCDELKYKYLEKNKTKLLIIKYTQRITERNIIKLIKQCLKK